MKNLWSDTESDEFKDDLALRVYTSRLLGQDPSLVLHGGGNTSVKITETNLVGSKEEILYIKGSGGGSAADAQHIAAELSPSIKTSPKLLVVSKKLI